MAKDNTSVRNEIDVEVPYVSNDGTRGIKKVHIMFVTQRMYKEYTQLLQDLTEVIQLNSRLENITEDMGASVASRVDIAKGDDGKLTTIRKGFGVIREEIKNLQQEYDNIIARVSTISNELGSKKHNLIVNILNKNGITDSDMLSQEWWEDCTDMSEDMKFIYTVCTKDDDNLGNKKKLERVIKSSI